MINLEVPPLSRDAFQYMLVYIQMYPCEEIYMAYVFVLDVKVVIT